MNGWKYYNHAIIASTPPHVNPDIKCVNDGSVWGFSKGVPLFVRWTTDFDCGYETEWWYCVKDDEMDINKLKKKRRYEITSGIKNFEVRVISPREFSEDLFSVYHNAFQNYVNAGKGMSKEVFISECIKHDNDHRIEYYGAFDKEDGKLAGYALNHVFDDYVNFSIMKFAPKYLSKRVSAALVYTMLCDYLNTRKKKYVNDGERSIRHVTNFQEYLIKYFGFRRAYCKLHVQYRNIVKMGINLLYPWRSIIKKFAVNSLINNVSALLELETIRRSFIDK
ncbi:hypothetical protein P9314_08560 [Paenibacillus validus]|uniref:hypothetical protein n=1 Tax=Paenibacillus validus TaxID=44253 RepID=UPI000FDC1E1A|nr:hypothetical protein [Paenibacillus validus]MED4600755.1 hypothetical protein [Paenibacillus validus]MED4606174.1 hypothetical protein [Paenibacillus validus]